MRQSFFILLIVFSSCNKEDETFIAKDVLAWNQEIAESKFVDQHGDSMSLPPIPPVTEYYADDNFVVDDEGVLYFFAQKDIPHNSCMPKFEYDQKPRHIGLRPSDIKIVPENDIAEFLQNNVKPSEYSESHFIFFSSAKDTFRSPKLSKIMRLLEQDTITSYRWFIRTMTDEERVVLKHKKSNSLYDPNKIAWDTTKLNFNHAKK